MIARSVLSDHGPDRLDSDPSERKRKNQDYRENVSRVTIEIPS